MKYDNASGTSGAVQERICARCHGFLVPSFTNSLLVEITEKSSATAWRCVNCGEWIDATIVANRGARRSNEADRTRSALVSLRRWRW